MELNLNLMSYSLLYMKMRRKFFSSNFKNSPKKTIFAYE